MVAIKINRKALKRGLDLRKKSMPTKTGGLQPISAELKKTRGGVGEAVQ